jgi:hypothetical protein
LILNVRFYEFSARRQLANPALDRQQYAELFRLNAVQLEQLATLTPRRELLLKRDRLSKILALDVDASSYALYTNTPIDHARRDDDGPVPVPDAGRRQAAWV